jgi:threonine/homoserine/homoserine lactone efflux protein
MLAYWLLGFALGAGSSVIPGPCGLTVMHTATRTGLRRAVATAIGAGLGDLAYATLGVFGVGHMLARDRGLVSLMLALSGIVLITYGVMCLRWRPSRLRRTPHLLGGLAIGFATLLSNPGSLVTWSAVVGTELSDAPWGHKLCAVVGIGVGSMMWFSLVAYVSARGTSYLGKSLHRIVPVFGGLICAYGVASLARAVL